MDWLRGYTVPFLLAFLMHLFVMLVPIVITQSLMFESATTVFEPKAIRATLIVANFDVDSPSTYSAPTAPVIQQDVVEALTEVAAEDPDTIFEDELELESEKKRLQTLEELRNATLGQSLDEELKLLELQNLDEETTSYVNAIYSSIVRRWSRPPSARRDMEAVVQVELFPNGELNTVNVVESSGNDAFDRSTLTAVRKVEKFEVPQDKNVFEAKFRKFNLRFKGEDLLR